MNLMNLRAKRQISGRIPCPSCASKQQYLLVQSLIILESELFTREDTVTYNPLQTLLVMKSSLCSSWEKHALYRCSGGLHPTWLVISTPQKGRKVLGDHHLISTVENRWHIQKHQTHPRMVWFKSRCHFQIENCKRKSWENKKGWCPPVIFVGLDSPHGN